jgi:alcohol dehydrogenase class IV
MKTQISQANKEIQEFLNNHKKNNKYLKKLNIILGYKNHEEYAEKMKILGSKVLFCTDDRAMRNLGFLDMYLELFRKKGFEVLVYDNITPNPTLSQMEQGAEKTKDFNPDFIFALGGGSVIDTAKAISVGVFGNLWDFVEKNQEIKKSVPVVASSTTSGTGSQLTPYAVVTNTSTLEKKTLKNNLLVPGISITDLDIVKSMPKKIIAETGFDVLCHALEVYTRKDCSETAEKACVKALTLVKNSLVASYENDSPEHKLEMMKADVYAGIALALIGTHLPHAISHPISARFREISHGKALSYIMPETIRKLKEKNILQLNEKLKKSSELLGGGSDAARTLKNYIKLLDLKNNRIYFSEKECEDIFRDTLGYRKSSVEKSPAALSEKDIKEIIYSSLK